MRIAITPRRASGLAPPSNAAVRPRTRPMLLDVAIKSRKQRAAMATTELPALMRRQAG